MFGERPSRSNLTSALNSREPFPLMKHFAHVAFISRVTATRSLPHEVFSAGCWQCI